MLSLIVASLSALLASTGIPAAPPPSITYAQQMPRPAPQALTVLSYNVEGLPWPAARGRSTAAHAIAAALRALRDQGDAPQVVAIQEGFRAADRHIGRWAGYAYSAFGPSDHDRGAAATTPAEWQFARDANSVKGELAGRHVGSGLAIFSDFPILWVKQKPFPAYACAGFDCLANKGMLAVALQVPGSAMPVILIDTHLNSRTASGTRDARSTYAYERQVDALSLFVGEVAPAGAPVVLVGDFNVGGERERAPYVLNTLIAPSGLVIAAAEQDCGPACRQPAPASPDAAAMLKRAKTMLAFRGLTPDAAPPAVFGRASDGTMLSDHIGLAVRFAL
jgi:endonuclease/exonuclease/phosphatase family metal-dependent hydrolase